MAKAIILRMAEWGAWFPLEKDHAEPRLLAAQGITGFQVDEGEWLVDVDVMPVTQREQHFPITDPEGKVHNIKHRLLVFRATLARETTDIAEEAFDSGLTAPNEGLGSSLVDPRRTNNRPPNPGG